MSNTQLKRKPSNRKQARKAGSRQSSPHTSASETKHAKIVALLTAPSGATIAAMMKATGWQQHSVRGFLAGIVRKKLKLDLDSELVDEVRRYRIKPPADGASKSAKAA